MEKNHKFRETSDLGRKRGRQRFCVPAATPQNPTQLSPAPPVRLLRTRMAAVSTDGFALLQGS
ncbi:unnamed protein product [Lupinus luteus]|uniref:Uncharacterized protein n=1 Tax=Lupinus luteus TaxID=3873 RepID=A0AAV1VRK5_LUPLU